MKFLLLLLAAGFIVSFGSGPASHFHFNSPFDSYGAICWEDEQARLDNFAISLNNLPDGIGNIIVYDGKNACRGEAIARAVRAKKYLVEYRKVDANRIAWRWGGYQSDPNTTLVLMNRDASLWPLTPSLPLEEVTFHGNCSRKVRSVKCPKR